jgi:hypothetical protein
MSFVSAQSKYIPNNTQSQRQFALGMYKPRNIPSTKMEAIKELPVSNDSFVNKVKWGEPTWFLFHTLSVKIKESEFLRVRKELLNCIYSICVNLPCPICAEHAKQYLDNINFNTIQTTEDFQKMLYLFHNSVNVRKGYSLFPYDELHSKYSLAITTNIIRNFMVHFTEKSRNPKLIASDFLRSRIAITLKKWFNENIQVFDV